MVPFAGLLAALEGIADPRRRQGRRYPLAHLLLFSVLAVLAGATSCRGILTFIGVHRERLNAVFGALQLPTSLTSRRGRYSCGFDLCLSPTRSLDVESLQTAQHRGTRSGRSRQGIDSA